MENVFESFGTHIQTLIKREVKEAVKAAVNDLQLQTAQERKYSNERVAAKHFSISEQTLARARKAGRIPFYRIGGRIVYDLNEVENAIRGSEGYSDAFSHYNKKGGTR